MRQRVVTAGVLAALVFGCSSAPAEPDPSVLAIEDYIAVAELPEVKRFLADRSHTVKLDNVRYVLLKARRQTYLIEFTRDCQEILGSTRVTPDVRTEGDYLRAGRDTIRGCRIKRAFELNEAQVQEIEDLGDAPTGG